MAKTPETTHENDGQISRISSAPKSLADRAEDLACELQEKLVGGASSDQFRLMGHAAIAVAFLEAVRALKPPTFAEMASAAIGQRSLPEPEDSPRMQGYRECADLKKFEIEGLLVENATLNVESERLQSVVAYQALTIATLKDELAQTRHLLSEERALTAATVGGKAPAY